MFLTPNKFWNLNESSNWYKNSTVGINEIAKWVKIAADETGLDVKKRKISNHSIRSTADDFRHPTLEKLTSFWFFGILLRLVHTVCGVKHPKGVPNIVNGSTTSTGDYPWQAALFYRSTQEFFCGRSIIDQNIILTAAHCITDYDGKIQPASNYLVAAGKYFSKYDEDGDRLAQYSNVSAIHVPERYAGIINMFALYIAILILSNPFTLTEAVQPVCIELNEASSYLTLSPYDERIVTGWGYTQEGGVVSDVLKELTIPYIPYKTCFNEVPNSFRRYLTQDKICGGYRNNATSICIGDSGGALVFKSISSDRYFVQGIVSTSPATIAATCDSNQYSLFTNVNNHIRFMQLIVATNQL